jgi:PTH2 family peptidyl-tRNA hydrolase
MPQFKQAIVLREDLEMSKGKTISQACHASLNSFKESSEEAREEWEKQGAKKVVLDIGEHSLQDRFQESKALQMAAALVKDAGRTELEPGTVTALGIGPAEEEKIDKVTSDLKLV